MWKFDGGFCENCYKLEVGIPYSFQEECNVCLNCCPCENENELRIKGLEFRIEWLEKEIIIAKNKINGIKNI